VQAYHVTNRGHLPSGFLDPLYLNFGMVLYYGSVSAAYLQWCIWHVFRKVLILNLSLGTYFHDLTFSQFVCNITLLYSSFASLWWC